MYRVFESSTFGSYGSDWFGKHWPLQPAMRTKNLSCVSVREGSFANAVRGIENSW